MTIESARAWLAQYAPDLQLIDHGVSTATVAEAAAALGAEPARIAKTLALRVGDQAMLAVARGGARGPKRNLLLRGLDPVQRGNKSLHYVTSLASKAQVRVL